MVGIRQLATITGLADLALLNVPIDNQGLAELSGLPNLTALTIQRSALLNDDGLQFLQRLPKLTKLSLLDVNITD